MKEVTVEITNESGLHARPATAFTQLAAKFGTSVVLTADGADEDDALAALSEFLTTNHD